MVFCGLHMKEVKRTRCLYCKEQGSPDHCIYTRHEPVQSKLKVEL